MTMKKHLTKKDISVEEFFYTDLYGSFIGQCQIYIKPWNIAIWMPLYLNDSKLSCTFPTTRIACIHDPEQPIKTHSVQFYSSVISKKVEKMVAEAILDEMLKDKETGFKNFPDFRYLFSSEPPNDEEATTEESLLNN